MEYGSNSDVSMDIMDIKKKGRSWEHDKMRKTYIYFSGDLEL